MRDTKQDIGGGSHAPQKEFPHVSENLDKFRQSWKIRVTRGKSMSKKMFLFPAKI